MGRAAKQPDGVPRRRGWGKGSIRWKNGAWEITVRRYRGADQDPWIRLPGDSLQEAEARLRDWDVFLCGPPPMTDGVLGALVGLGLPPEQIHAERFVAV